MAPKADDFVRGLVFLMLSLFLFALMDAVQRILSRDYPLGLLLWVRFAFIFVFGIFMVGPRNLGGAIRSKIPWLQLGRSLMLVIEMGAFILSFRYMAIGDVHAIAAVTPLTVLIFSALLLREHAGWRVWAAVGVGFLGVLVIIRPGFRTVEWFYIIPVFATATWGIYQTMARMVGRHDTPATTLLWTGAVGFAVLCFIGPFYIVPIDARGAGLMLITGVLGVFAHYTLLKAYEVCSAVRLQPYSYALVLWAIVAGFVLLGEFPDAPTLAGAAIIIAAGIYTWHSERRRAARVNGKMAAPGD
jgi:drug/metabolite transporter (DMT)-like permease